MKDFLIVFTGIIITGMVVLLCFFCCYMAGRADEYWDELKKEMEKRNGKR